MIFLATFLFPGLSGAGEKAPVEITVNMTKEMVSLEDVNSGAKKFTIQYRNRSKTPQVIHPLVELKIVDSRGLVVKPNRHLGRFGWRLTKCALGGKVFRTLKPGEVFLQKFRISEYMIDPMWIHGWTLPSKGKYELVFTYGFDRAAFIKRCPHSCREHEDADQPWNRAVEMKKEIRVVLDVKRP
jgi:hypothetical protein